MNKVIDNPEISNEDKIDILELEEKINRFGRGEIDEERFKLYRLTRGVYGQRQLGVQMFRIKIPFGRLTAEQLVRIAEVSDKYATGNLHITTRQDIQLHYVKLKDSPKVWADLAEKKITAREACGNTVRNVTASEKAGIDPDEPFDVSPYAHATAHYFMRNPICQEMGRKIKPAFSSSDKDSAAGYFHDFGFIPKVKRINGQEVRGFRVLIAGGLGAVGMVAQEAYDFLPEDQILPFMEAALRIFDRHGEREKRQKARMKFLLKDLGLETLMTLINNEREALDTSNIPIDRNIVPEAGPVADFEPDVINPKNSAKFILWRKTNVFEQKQKGFFGVYLKIQLGDIKSDKARTLSEIIEKYAADDIRLTANQNILLKFVRERHLAELFTELDKHQLAEPGFDSIADITACPGTDTCNLGVTNSTGLAQILEEMIQTEYVHLVEEHHIKIKISGCMNACGQHMAAQIGFSGSSIKNKGLVYPAMQVVLGGGVDPHGLGFIGEKVVKIPTKKIPECVRLILNDFENNATEGTYFNDYYYEKGKMYFYDFLKPLALTEDFTDDLLMDWGQDHHYQQEIGVGECAGVIMDVVGTIIVDAKERLEFSQASYLSGDFADSAYFSYSAMVIGAKALLLSDDVKCNTHQKIITDFNELFVANGKFRFNGNFEEEVLLFNKKKPTQRFAKSYLETAKEFVDKCISYRSESLVHEDADKKVVDSYYKA
jgi:sulfite reductase (ferredoxin)